MSNEDMYGAYFSHDQADVHGHGLHYTREYTCKNVETGKQAKVTGYFRSEAAFKLCIKTWNRDKRWEYTA